MKVNKDKVVIAILLLLLFFLLKFCFNHIILAHYPEYVKFVNGNTNSFSIIISSIIVVILSGSLIFLPVSNLIFSFLSLILVLIIYPSVVLFQHLNADPRVLFFNVVYFLSVFLLSRILKFKIEAPKLSENQKVPFLLILSSVLIVPFVVLFGTSIDFQNLLLSNIYESRDIQRKLTNPYIGYVYSPLANVLLPLLLLTAFLKKKYFVAIAAFGMLLFMFMVGGHKSVFFGLIMVVFFYRWSQLKKMKLFLYGLISVIGLGIVLAQTLDNFFLVGLITTRVFYLPNLLDLAYFEFFDGHPIFWSDSVLRRFIHYPYELSAPLVIGEYVYGKSGVHANNGIISDGFMNFGNWGVLINIFFVSSLLVLVNNLRISHRYFGLIFLFFFTFTFSYFFTSMVTQGGALFIILSLFFLRGTDQDD
ncbi:MAG: hypothetical protein JST48_04020 [Bacteroidetes bacterium]|nr:hypothetical protein [Bacteroidota bacterium]